MSLWISGGRRRMCEPSASALGNATQIPARPHSGVFMATATATSSAAPSRDDFAAMLEESFTQGGTPQEGSVVKGIIVGIEKDLAVIDVGAKTEGRVALREFSGRGRQNELKIGDTVEVYLERVEKRAGARSNWPSRTTRRSTASSSTRSRAASPSISTARWRSCRARRSTSGRSATSRR